MVLHQQLAEKLWLMWTEFSNESENVQQCTEVREGMASPYWKHGTPGFDSQNLPSALMLLIPVSGK